ncbi:MAG: glycosyltransferase [Muribaculaceae bacterium]|nr:glycosyltransferase [Muribaculaceae bacterium]
MIQFDFHLPVASIILLGLALAALAYICLVYCRRLWRLRRHKRLCDSGDRQVDTLSLPWASVIVYARGDSESLARHLPAMLEQDYMPGYEVIVVNDGSEEEVSMAVKLLRNTYPNIYLTFTPDGARNLSRKKLALTLGVKAAKGEAVVITDATTKVNSDRWLVSMMSPLADPDVDIVLGYGRPAARGFLTKQFDLAADSAAWLLSALSGKTYRACGSNLAYRRQAFFDNKGFSRSLNLRNGDDDIFVSEIAQGRGVAVEMSQDSIVDIEVPAFARWAKEFRRAHMFTGRRLAKGSRRIMAAGEWCLWLVPLLAAAGAWLAGPYNAVGWIAALLLTVAAWTVPAIAWSGLLRSLGVKARGIALPLMAMARPLRNTYAAVRARLSHGHYSWQK